MALIHATAFALVVCSYSNLSLACAVGDIHTSGNLAGTGRVVFLPSEGPVGCAVDYEAIVRNTSVGSKSFRYLQRQVVSHRQAGTVRDPLSPPDGSLDIVDGGKITISASPLKKSCGEESRLTESFELIPGHSYSAQFITDGARSRRIALVDDSATASALETVMVPTVDDRNDQEAVSLRHVNANGRSNTHLVSDANQ